ncbi:unnamed protein product [Effrenium voratum]|nr:unnamed protein product [Effrenium voratum]
MRPLAYPGRILTPVVEEKDNPWIWRASNLVKNRRNSDDAKQDGVTFSSQTVLRIVDLTPLNGSMFEGFLEVSKDLNVPCQYCPIFMDEPREEWFNLHFQNEMASMFQSGDLVVPNVERLAENPPAEHMEEKPEPPPLKRCVYGKVEGDVVTLEIPDPIIQKFSQRQEFKTLLDQFLERHPPLQKVKDEKNKKRPTTAAGLGPAATPKRQRLDDQIIQRLLKHEDDCPAGPFLAEVPMVNARVTGGLGTEQATLVVTNSLAFVRNKTGGKVSLNFGMVVAGWGKGKFRERTVDNPRQSGELEFLVRADDLLLVDGKVDNASSILSQNKAKKLEACKISYHACKQNPDTTWEIKQEGGVIFTPLEEDAKSLTQSQVAKLTSGTEVWTSALTSTVWHCKWSLNGLQPIRPVVMLLEDVELENGKILLFQS